MLHGNVLCILSYWSILHPQKYMFIPIDFHLYLTKGVSTRWTTQCPAKSRTFVYTTSQCWMPRDQQYLVKCVQYCCGDVYRSTQYPLQWTHLNSKIFWAVWDPLNILANVTLYTISFHLGIAHKLRQYMMQLTDGLSGPRAANVCCYPRSQHLWSSRIRFTLLFITTAKINKDYYK